MIAEFEWRWEEQRLQAGACRQLLSVLLPPPRTPLISPVTALHSTSQSVVGGQWSVVTRAVAATGEAEGDMDAVQRVVHGRQPHRLRTAQNQTLHHALVRMLVTSGLRPVTGD